MITAYVLNELFLQKYTITVDNGNLLQNAMWIDILQPTKEDEKLVETATGLNVPTREEMQEIEISSRLYKESNALFMTASILANSNSSNPKLDAVTFILTEKQLITVRYFEPQSFKIFDSRITRLANELHTSQKILIDLLDAIIDRNADILEQIGRNLDSFSQTIFRPTNINTSQPKVDLQQTLQDIGANGDLGAKARESLLSFNRLAAYFDLNVGSKLDKDTHSNLTSIAKDITALSDHAGFLSSQASFLLNATLGMINIEQNNIIRIFSIAAVIFLPPTLIASFYGMNFDFMPELHWRLGYPLAILLMFCSAWIPYRYFKRRNWL